MLRFIREGYLVVAVDLASSVHETAEAAGDLCVPVEADVLTKEGQDSVARVLREVGGTDHVVAIAGGATAEEMGVEDPESVTEEVFSESIQKNLVSAWSFLRSTLPGLRTRTTENRSVTFCSSRNAVAGHGLYAYSAAKAGLLGLVNPLAVKLGAEGIRVNAVLPGQIATPTALRLHSDPGHFEKVAARTSLQRLTTEEDCADVFWALTTMRGVSGAAVMVDGGAHVWRDA